MGPQQQQRASQAYNQFLQPITPESIQDVFQKSIVDPTMQTYQRKVLPAIQQRFVDANAGSSSALNQALAQSATDLSTVLGSQFGQFFQNQQRNQLGALGQLGSLSQAKTFEPMIHESKGILGGLIDLISPLVNPLSWRGGK